MPNVDFIDTLAFGIDAEHTRKRCGVKMVQGGEEIIVRYVAGWQKIRCTHSFVVNMIEL